jgi:hypothetical protein
MKKKKFSELIGITGFYLDITGFYTVLLFSVSITFIIIPVIYPVLLTYLFLTLSFFVLHLIIKPRMKELHLYLEPKDKTVLTVLLPLLFSSTLSVYVLSYLNKQVGLILNNLILSAKAYIFQQAAFMSVLILIVTIVVLAMVSILISYFSAIKANHKKFYIWGGMLIVLLVSWLIFGFVFEFITDNNDLTLYLVPILVGSMPLLIIKYLYIN